MTSVTPVAPAGPSAGAWAEVPLPPAPPARRAWWRPLLALVVLAGPVVTLVRQPSVGSVVWTVVGALLAGWVVPARPVLRALPTPGPAARPGVAVLCALAAWSSWAGHGAVRTFVPYAMALVLPLLSRLGHGAMERVLERFARFVGNLVAAVLFWALGTLVVVVPWAGHRLVGADPLRGPQGWASRSRRDPRPANLWGPAGASMPAPPSVRVRTAVLGGAVAALVLVVTPLGPALVDRIRGVGPTAEPFRLTPPPDDPVRFEIRDRVPPGVTADQPGPDAPQAAMASSTWMADGLYQAAQGWALDPRNAWRPVNPHRLRDLRSAYLNVVDGERVSWTPPPSDRPRLTVWLFGGSTTYGLNQRDDHTIASELARVAHDAGVDLDVHNKGMNGQLHWMEAERFAWDLASEPRPDLVLFYDGVNESWEGTLLNRFGTGDTPEMFDPTMVDAAVNARGTAEVEVPQAPPGGRVVGRTKGPVLQLVAQARAMIDRYDRARELSRATAAAHGIPVRYFWQPSRVSRPLVMAEPHADTGEENALRLSEQLKVSYLSPDVIDLSASLRGSTEPLFTDDVHHNEFAARLIAEQMFARIEPEVRGLVAAREAGG